MTQEEKVIETARRCAMCWFLKVYRDELPKEFEELDKALKDYEKSITYGPN